MIWNHKILLPAVVMLATGANGWRFVVYADSECETEPTADYSGAGNQGCTANLISHRGLELYELGNCWVALYASEADCNSRNSQAQYWSANEDVCIPPHFIWVAIESKATRCFFVEKS
jgi:hypothetical protein